MTSTQSTVQSTETTGRVTSTETIASTVGETTASPSETTSEGTAAYIYENSIFSHFSNIVDWVIIDVGHIEILYLG